ncbi:MAG: ECF transporter S component [Clostridia bacterium]|nr:ECF transporter S component [Clostridia bacterium]
MKMQVNKITRMGVLCALSIVLLVFIHFPIFPTAAYLEYDPADVPLLIGAFMYGPLAGFIMTVIVSVIQAATVSAKSGWVGAVMHIIASGALVVVAGAVYKKYHTLKGAIAGLIAGTLSMALVMIPSNLFFTVKFFGVPQNVVLGMLPTVIIPFNLIKASINCVIAALVYKALGRFLKGQAVKALES